MVSRWRQVPGALRIRWRGAGRAVNIGGRQRIHRCRPHRSGLQGLLHAEQDALVVAAGVVQLVFLVRCGNSTAASYGVLTWSISTLKVLACELSQPKNCMDPLEATSMPQGLRGFQYAHSRGARRYGGALRSGRGLC